MNGHEEMVKPKVAVLGGRGMLGSDVALACRQNGFTTTVLDLPKFDIRNESHLTTVLRQVDAVVNCAAYTEVDKAESARGGELAYQVNAESVGKLGQAAKKSNVRVLHISTDFVFDGEKDKPYTETDKPNPINVYGQTKLKGEQLLAESESNYTILRLEWTYGLHGDNFITKILKHSKTKRKLKVVEDQVGSPTATSDVAGVICELLGKETEGTFHYAAKGYVSRFGMAEFIFENLNIPVELEACKTEDFQSDARRPLNSCFNCNKIKKLLDNPIESWENLLERFLHKL